MKLLPDSTGGCLLHAGPLFWSICFGLLEITKLMAGKTPVHNSGQKGLDTGSSLHKTADSATLSGDYTVLAGSAVFLCCPGPIHAIEVSLSVEPRPLVSGITATYNMDRYVGQAVDSILAQTYTPSEAIVVDDGSTDDTRQLLARYRGDPRVRIVRQANAGQTAAKNRA